MASTYTPEQRAENREKAAIYKERRLALGLTQKQLSKLSGVCVNTITRMEAGINFPQWETRQKLRRALGMPEERFYSVAERNAIFFELQETVEWAVRRKLYILRKLGAASFSEDLRQASILYALQAIDRCRPDGGASIKTFVHRNVDFFIDRWILKFRRHGLTGKVCYPDPVTYVYSLDALMEAQFQLEG